MKRLLYALRCARAGFLAGWDAWRLVHDYAQSVADDDVRDPAEEMEIAAGTALLEREGAQDGQ